MDQQDIDYGMDFEGSKMAHHSQGEPPPDVPDAGQPHPDSKPFHVSRDFHCGPDVPLSGCVNIYLLLLWKLSEGERAAAIKATAVHVWLTRLTSAVLEVDVW